MNRRRERTMHLADRAIDAGRTDNPVRPRPERDRIVRSTPGRRGAFLIVALICLVIATLLLGSLLKLATVQHRQMLSEQARLQAEWLAESGLARAAHKLA